MNANAINDAINRAGGNSIRRAALMSKLMQEIAWHCDDDDIASIAASINKQADQIEANELDQRAEAARATA